MENISLIWTFSFGSEKEGKHYSKDKKKKKKKSKEVKLEFLRFHANVLNVYTNALLMRWIVPLCFQQDEKSKKKHKHKKKEKDDTPTSDEKEKKKKKSRHKKTDVDELEDFLGGGAPVKLDDGDYEEL